MNTASIEAKVFAVAAAVGAGGAGLGVAIGVSVARNFIGWDPSGGPTYTCIAPNCYASTATTSSITAGKRVKVVTGARTGDVYEYVGATTLTNADLTVQEYGDASLWKQVLVSPNAAEVQAYVLRSSVTATGQLKLQATSSQTIDAIVVAGAVALSGGGAGVSVSGAGVFVENKIATAVKAFVDGDGATGISAPRHPDHRRRRLEHPLDRRRRLDRRFHRRGRRRRLDRPRDRVQRGLGRRRGVIKNADTKVEATNGDIKVSATSHGAAGVTLSRRHGSRSSTTPRTAEQDDPDTSSTDEAAVDAAADKLALIAIDNAFRNAGNELQLRLRLHDRLRHEDAEQGRHRQGPRRLCRRHGYGRSHLPLHRHEWLVAEPRHAELRDDPPTGSASCRR